MIRGLMHRTRPLAVLAAFLCTATVAHAQGFGGTVADHLVRGDSLLAQGKTAEAIVQLQEARTLCPPPTEVVAALQSGAPGRLVQGEGVAAGGPLPGAAAR